MFKWMVHTCEMFEITIHILRDATDQYSVFGACEFISNILAKNTIHPSDSSKGKTHPSFH